MPFAVWNRVYVANQASMVNLAAQLTQSILESGVPVPAKKCINHLCHCADETREQKNLVQNVCLDPI